MTTYLLGQDAADGFRFKEVRRNIYDHNVDDIMM